MKKMNYYKYIFPITLLMSFNALSFESCLGGNRTMPEINGCLSDKSTSKNELLDIYFKESLNKFKNNEKTLEILRAAQQSWIDYSRKHCSVVRSKYEGGSIAPTIYTGCLNRLIEIRTHEIWSYYLTGGCDTSTLPEPKLDG